jgi:hypothetical protein
VLRAALLLAVALTPQIAHAVEPPRDCVFGVAVWCFASSPRDTALPRPRFRLDTFGGYKLGTSYYGAEARACREAGCAIDFSGPALGLDAFYNVAGNAHHDDYFDIGLSTSYMPIATISRNASGFEGELGRVAPGDGSLAYVPIRIAVRRPNFLLIIKSKYLLSSFGAGIAIPVTSGSGSTFTGGDGVKPTVGGRLGLQWPIGDHVQIGLATNWTVVWYGGLFEASFQTSYGLNLAFSS